MADKYFICIGWLVFCILIVRMQDGFFDYLLHKKDCVPIEATLKDQTSEYAAGRFYNRNIYSVFEYQYDGNIRTVKLHTNINDEPNRKLILYRSDMGKIFRGEFNIPVEWEKKYLLILVFLVNCFLLGRIIWLRKTDEKTWCRNHYLGNPNDLFSVRPYNKESK